MQLLEDQSSSAQRAWRKQINKRSNLLADSRTVELLKTERAFLETRMEILNAANERLYEALEENYDARKEATMKFEILEREHSETLQKISERIIEIKQETGSGRSRNSKRSSRDSQSQKSNGSSVASSSKLTRKTAMAANVARLKTELEFADTEERNTTALKEHEDELKRFKLTEELAKAEIEAVMKTEEDERGRLIGRRKFTGRD